MISKRCIQVPYSAGIDLSLFYHNNKPTPKVRATIAYIPATLLSKRKFCRVVCASSILLYPVFVRTYSYERTCKYTAFFRYLQIRAWLPQYIQSCLYIISGGCTVSLHIINFINSNRMKNVSDSLQAQWQENKQQLNNLLEQQERIFRNKRG